MTVLEDLKKNGAKTVNVAINNMPVWLFEALKQEAQEYGDAYFPVLVNWYRKANQFDEVLEQSEEPPEEVDKGVEVFGGGR